MKTTFNALFLACLLATAAPVGSVWVSSRTPTNAGTRARSDALIKKDSEFLQGYPHLPLRFEANRGQADRLPTAKMHSPLL